MANVKQCYAIDEEGRIHFDDEAFKSFIIDVIISRTTMELETTAGTIVDRVGRLKIFYGKAVPDIKYVRAIKDHIYKILMRMRNEEILIEKRDGYYGEVYFVSDDYVEKQTQDFTLDESSFVKANQNLKAYSFDDVGNIIFDKNVIKEMILNAVTYATEENTLIDIHELEDCLQADVFNEYGVNSFKNTSALTSIINSSVREMNMDNIIVFVDDPLSDYEWIELSDDYLSKQTQDFTLDESVEISNQPPIYSIDKHRDVAFIKENIKEIILNILINATYRNEYYEKHVVTADVVDIAERTGHKIGWPPNYANFLSSLRNAVYNAIDELVEANILTYIVDDFDTGARFLQLSDAYIAKQTENFNLDESKSHDLSFKQKIVNNIIDLLSEQPVVEKDQIKYWVIPTHDADDPVYIDSNNYEIADAIIEELIDNGMIVYADDTDTSLREFVSLSDDYFAEEVESFNLDEGIEIHPDNPIADLFTINQDKTITFNKKNISKLLVDLVAQSTNDPNFGRLTFHDLLNNALEFFNWPGTFRGLIRSEQNSQTYGYLYNLVNELIASKVLAEDDAQWLIVTDEYIANETSEFNLD